MNNNYEIDDEFEVNQNICQMEKYTELRAIYSKVHAYAFSRINLY